MLKVDVEQGSQIWLNLKAGVPSASNFDKIVTTKGVRSKTADKYVLQLAGEKVTGKREEGYKSKHMINGIDMEPEASGFYEIGTGATLEIVGLVYKDEKKSFLCSPDRLICDSKGLLEIKCPKLTTQVSYLLNPKSLESAYFQQVQGQLFVTGYEWCDLMSYFPGLKPVIIRIKRDEAFMSALEFELKVVCAEIEKIVEKIK